MSAYRPRAGTIGAEVQVSERAVEACCHPPLIIRYPIRLRAQTSQPNGYSYRLGIQDMEFHGGCINKQCNCLSNARIVSRHRSSCERTARNWVGARPKIREPNPIYVEMGQRFWDQDRRPSRLSLRCSARGFRGNSNPRGQLFLPRNEHQRIRRDLVELPGKTPMSAGLPTTHVSPFHIALDDLYPRTDRSRQKSHERVR